MKTTISINGTERTFITDFASLDKFIHENAGKYYDSAVITPQLARSFNPLNYLDVFRIADKDFCSGHGSSDFVNCIIAPEVSKWKPGDGKEEWYEITLGHPATKTTLERIVYTLKELLEEY